MKTKTDVIHTAKFIMILVIDIYPPVCYVNYAIKEVLPDNYGTSYDGALKAVLQSAWFCTSFVVSRTGETSDDVKDCSDWHIKVHVIHTPQRWAMIYGFIKIQHQPLRSSSIFQLYATHCSLHGCLCFSENSKAPCFTSIQCCWPCITLINSPFQP